MTSRRALQILITCEHANNAVPREYARLFASREARALLDTHRGWDPGALPVARALARRFDAPLLVGDYTRLLVDLNRSPHHPRVLSEFTRALPRPERAAILARYHAPHHARALELARKLGRAGPVLHLAIHSFTPVLGDEVRTTDLGLLYDPARERESALARALQADLRALLAAAPRRSSKPSRAATSADERPGVVHRNAPYRGASDGLATRLRGLLPPSRYLGFEIELNQRWPSRTFVGPLEAAIERALHPRLNLRTTT